MENSGGKDPKAKQTVQLKHPKRTKREWQEITNQKLRQWESLGSDLNGKGFRNKGEV